MMKAPLRIAAAALSVAVMALLLAAPPAPAQNADEEEIVASLQRITGEVEVAQADDGQVVQGRNGLLLRAGDEVRTAEDSRATVQFRDGSEVRLFQNTTFVVQQSEESAGAERFFKVNLLMKLGSLWGNFVKQRQVANINTPTATIGIKGTTLRVVERDGRGRVALTEGLIDVSNERSTVELQPGTRLTDFTARDDLATKVADIPYKLELSSEKRRLRFPGDRAEEVFISVQLVEVDSGEPVRRSGRLYLRSNYDRIEFPRSASLDERGSARVALRVAPPQPSDAELDGNVFVWALIDEGDADDTGEGRILFEIPVPDGEERIRVEAESGEGRRVQ